MAQASRDQNRVATLLGVSNADNTTPVAIWADPVTHRLLVDLPAGSGTVTSVSVATANGFAGTVADPTTTPAITLSTTATGILQGDGTAISAITVGTGLTFSAGTLSANNNGDVVGPASATDNAVARFDLTTGKLIQNSGVIVSDTNSITGVVNLTTTGQILSASGTVSAPGLSFSAQSSTGFYYNGAGDVIYSSAGAASIRFNGSNFVVGSGGTGALYFSSSGVAIGSFAPALWYDGAQGVLAQRNSSSAQTHRIYNTWTDASNYERFSITAQSANDVLLQTEKAGTGTARNLTLGTNSTSRWSIGATSGYLLPSADNTYDIGAATSNRVRNIYVNNYSANSASTVSAGGTTVLTVGSARNQAITGSSNQTFQLPDATTLSLGPWFVFNNNSSGSLIVTNAGGTTLYTVPAGGLVQCGPTSIATSNGTWDFHPLPPSTVTWSSGVTGLVMNTALTTTPTILAGASSATSPSFVPQRGAATTGFGGDGTNLHAVIGGATSTTFNSTGLSVGTSGVITTGTIELGAASDTTLARVSAGVVSIEGVNIMTVGATQTVTGQNKFNNIIDVNNAITASGNAATVPVTYRLSTVTNNSAATLTITMTTTSAVDGQMTIVRILDFSAAAQTISWVNTENSTISVPTTSNGSTTLPLTVGFMYNSATSKWRCIASA